MQNRSRLKFDGSPMKLTRSPKYVLAFAICCLGFGCILGCNPTVAPEVTDDEAESKLTVIGSLGVTVVGDEDLAEILQREWQSISDYEIEVTNRSTADFVEHLESGAKRIDADVVIYPSPLLGQLAERRLLRPVLKQSLGEAKYGQREIFNQVRRQETHWNQQPYAVPFGSPVLMLLRRTDLVKDAPETWTELGEVVTKLREGGSKDVLPLLQPMAEGWPARMLLARSTTYLFDNSKFSTVFSYTTMKPRIATAPFIRAAQEFTESLPSAQALAKQQLASELSPSDVLEAFLEGKSALAITWPMPSVGHQGGENVEFPIAISELPGSREHYVESGATPQSFDENQVKRVTLHGFDGRLGSVTRSAKNGDLANIFLAWATAPEQSVQLSPRSSHTAPFRLSHESSSRIWCHSGLSDDIARDYVRLTKEALNRSAAMQFPRLPGQHRYTLALDMAVRKIVAGEEAEAALQEASEVWGSISTELGVETQKAAYRHSLGIATN